MEKTDSAHNRHTCLRARVGGTKPHRNWLDPTALYINRRVAGYRETAGRQIPGALDRLAWELDGLLVQVHNAFAELPDE